MNETERRGFSDVMDASFEKQAGTLGDVGGFLLSPAGALGGMMRPKEEPNRILHGGVRGFTSGTAVLAPSIALQLLGARSAMRGSPGLGLALSGLGTVGALSSLPISFLRGMKGEGWI